MNSGSFYTLRRGDSRIAHQMQNVKCKVQNEDGFFADAQNDTVASTLPCHSEACNAEESVLFN